MGFFKRAWRGEEKLWKVFWLYGVLLYTVLSLVFLVLLVPVVLASLMIPAFGLVPFIIMLPYTVWVWVAVWRCAWNAKWRLWGYVARILVVVVILSTLYSIFTLVTGGNAGNQPFVATPGTVSSSTTTLPDGTVVTVEIGEDGSKTTTRVKNGSVSIDIDGGGGGADDSAPGSGATILAPGASINAPAPAPAASAGQAAPVAAPARDACEQKMHDFAVQNNTDPEVYIAQNQAYLAQCREALAGQQPRQ